MGNCIKKESSVHWGGEDWSSATSEPPFSSIHGSSCGSGKANNGDDDKGLLGINKASGSCPFSSVNGREVKITITKKQLAELVSRPDLQGATIQQVLLQLMSNLNGKYDSRHRSWSPALQCIPEAEVCFS